MTEIPKSSEREVPQELPDGQKATGWDSLADYDNGDSDYTHHSPFGEAPAINGNDLLDKRSVLRRCNSADAKIHFNQLRNSREKSSIIKSWRRLCARR